MFDEDLGELAGLRVPQVEVAPASVSAGRDSGKARKSRRPDWVEGRFLKGPVPLSWLERACALSGKAVLATALAIWFKAGLCGRKDRLELTGPTVRPFGVSPSAKSRALTALEAAGLVSVERRDRKNPLVTILEAKGAARAKGAGNRASAEQDVDSPVC